MNRSTFLKLGIASVLFPSVAGCSPAPMQVAQSSKDPSSPNAPDGIDPLSAAPASPRPASTSGTSAVVYACPMHPEMTSTAPGVCPKCNMKLVPKE
jgi:hypothetical protein